MRRGINQCTASAVEESPMLRHSKGEMVGKWVLVDSLGEGGNAEVWRASDGDADVALKILHTHKIDSEPYQRFRQEIQALRQIGSHPCIMPLLDADLPEAPAKAHPAWLAMPIAMPLAESLSQSALPVLVAVVAEIADTLANLHEHLQLHHRDIKPSNLYLLDGSPVISDFGLADLPEADDLTIMGRPLGPKFFLAYEMIVDSKGADPASADVFSLAKTLWVLCMDQRWPPQGEQHASNSAYSIGSIRPHPLAHHLDELIERCTRHEPSKRPSMRQVTEDLRAWLALGEKTPQQSVDLSAMWSRLRETAEPRLRQVNEEATLRLCFQAAVRRLQELLAPLHAEIRQEFPATAFNERPKFVETMFFDTLKREITNEDIRATILSGPGWDPILLIIGLSVRTRVSGELEFGSMFYLGSIKTMGGHLNSWRSERQRVPCGSILVEERLVALAEEVQGMFPSWLEQFIAALGSN